MAKGAQGSSLQARANCTPAVPVLLAASLGLLVAGWTLPALETQRLVVSVSSYSILGGIAGLWSGGHRAVALLVAAFSLAFPLVKLVGLGAAWFQALTPEALARRLRLLERLGKWSMLDVFVVAILLGTLNLGFPSGARARAGVWVFGASILLSMAAARVVRRDAGLREEPPPRCVGRSALAALAAGLAALVCLALGQWRLLLTTEKWQLWEAETTVLGGAAELWRDAPVLAVALVAFVVFLPLASLAWGVAGCGLAAAGGARGAAGWRRLEPWAMADVFVLALAVVAIKLDDVLEVHRGDGFAWLAAGALLSHAFARLSTARRPRA